MNFRFSVCLCAFTLVTAPLTRAYAQPEGNSTAAQGSVEPKATEATKATEAQAEQKQAPAASPDAQKSAANPHAQLPRDEVTVDPSLPEGTIVAKIADSSGRPLAGIAVRLGILFQSITEGNKRDHLQKTTDASGEVRFDGLEIERSHSYRVSVSRGPAEYASTPFVLDKGRGKRVLLHSYPFTHDPAKATLWYKGFIYISPRDDVFQFEIAFRVYNLSAVSWVPQHSVLGLPSGFKAFRAQEAMTDARFEEVEGEGAKLTGTFPPGERDISFRFQVPSEQVSSAVFAFRPPEPRIGELRVITESAPRMALDVQGWETPQVSSNQRGERVLVTRRLVQRRGERLDDFLVRLEGIPVPGPGRWVTLGLALAIAGFGVMSAKKGGPAREQSKAFGDKEFKRARRLLLEELASLRQARQQGVIGPRAYEQAEGALIDALARLQLGRRTRAAEA